MLLAPTKLIDWKNKIMTIFPTNWMLGHTPPQCQQLLLYIAWSWVKGAVNLLITLKGAQQSTQQTLPNYVYMHVYTHYFLFSLPSPWQYINSTFHLCSKHRLFPKVTEGDKAEMTKQLQREEENMFILRHPYLTLVGGVFISPLSYT